MTETFAKGNKPNKKINRRDFLKMVGVGSAAAVLASCAPKATTPTVTSAPTTQVATGPSPTATRKPLSAGPLNIDYWQDLNDEFKNNLAGFTKATGIQANHLPASPYAQWTQQMTTMLASGATDVDVIFGAQPDVKRWARAGWLTDLTDIIAADSDIDLGDYFPNSVSADTFDGKIYALPWGVDVILNAWRPTLFKAAGLTRVPQTWDELISFGKQLTHEPDLYGLALNGCIPGDDIWWDIGNYIEAAGGKIYELDTPQARKGIQFYKDLFTTYKIAQPSTPQDSYYTNWAPFIAGKFAQWIMWDLWTGGTATVPEMKGDVAWDWPPAGDAGVKTQAHVWGFCVNKFSKKQDLAAEWIKYANSIPALAIHASRGSTPPRVSMWKDPAVQAVSPQLAFWKNVNVNDLGDRVVWPFIAFDVSITQTVETNLSAYLTNQMSLDDCVSKTMEVITTPLQLEGYQFTKGYLK